MSQQLVSTTNFLWSAEQETTYPRSSRQTFVLLMVLALHVPLGLIMRDIPNLSTIHAIATVSLGLLFVAIDRHPHRLIYVCAYIVGAEVLWRGTKADVFWEFGKYAISFLLFIGLLKEERIMRASKVPLLYFLVLLPSIIVMPVIDRKMISFNLSGPLALAISTMFLGTVKLTADQMRRTLVAFVTPIISLAFLALSTTMAAPDLVFGTGSNFATSGNIGPNQVSSIFGLGAVAAFLYGLSETSNRVLKMVMLACSIWLFGQTLLTFSRGGVITSSAAVLISLPYLARQKKVRIALILACGTTLVLMYFFILPFLDQFTSGALKARYQQSSTTGRGLIVQSDLIAFVENPILGVGPHQSKAYHTLLFRFSSSHTEYSRMLAEHGIFGVIALLILMAITWKRFRATGGPMEKAYTVCFLTWALVFMAHSATRLVAPSFLFGLAAAKLLLSENVRRKTSLRMIPGRSAISALSRDIFFAPHNKVSGSK